jgi:nicotinamide-nucleotide amidase
MSNPRASLICVGSELLRGKINTHASHIARRLASIGLTLDDEHTVGDEKPEIAAAIRDAINRSQIIFVSGGLGPTFDDISRETAAEVTGRRLIQSARLLRGIRAKFRRAKYKMPTENARQADVLDGARVIPNPVGTAPGQWLEFEGHSKVLILLPGPPSELYPMLEQTVLPGLKKLFAPLPTAEAHLHFVGVPESIIDHKVRPIVARMRKKAGIRFTILAHLGLVDLDIFVSDASASRAKKIVRQIADSVRRVVGSAFYGMDADYPLEKVVGDRFRSKKATLAIAESCTGGMLAARLTDIAGSSDFVIESHVTYSNDSKVRTLGIAKELLAKHGAVSKPVAIAMAQGVRERAGSTWGMAVTGIAGPGGGSRLKPVGLVFTALSSKKRLVCTKHQFLGSRTTIRERAVLAMLDQLRNIIR